MKIPNNSSLEDMILISIDSVIQKENKCSFGNLVKECFIKYPKYFSLNDVPEYPDSLKLDRPLREMREKGIIVGSPTTFYSITNFGRNHLANLRNISGSQTSNVGGITTRSPGLQMLEKIKNSTDYTSFLKKEEKFEPKDMQFRSIVGFTLETPIQKINHELDFLIELSQKLNKPEVINYLKKYKTFFRNKK